MTSGAASRLRSKFPDSREKPVPALENHPIRTQNRRAINILNAILRAGRQGNFCAGLREQNAFDRELAAECGRIDVPLINRHAAFLRIDEISSRLLYRASPAFNKVTCPSAVTKTRAGGAWAHTRQR